MPNDRTANQDLDQSGNSFQTILVWMGPSLGWVRVQVKPSLYVTDAGITTIGAGYSVILVNVADAVTLQLPSVSAWVSEIAYQPSTGFERAIWIKDLGGNASAHNITVRPFGTDQIDLLAQDFTVVQNRQLLRLYPLNDLSGWFSG